MLPPLCTSSDSGSEIVRENHSTDTPSTATESSPPTPITLLTRAGSLHPALNHSTYPRLSKGKRRCGWHSNSRGLTTTRSVCHPALTGTLAPARESEVRSSAGYRIDICSRTRMTRVKKGRLGEHVWPVSLLRSRRNQRQMERGRGRRRGSGIALDCLRLLHLPILLGPTPAAPTARAMRQVQRDRALRQPPSPLRLPSRLGPARSPLLRWHRRRFRLRLLLRPRRRPRSLMAIHRLHRKQQDPPSSSLPRPSRITRSARTLLGIAKSPIARDTAQSTRVPAVRSWAASSRSRSNARLSVRTPVRSVGRIRNSSNTKRKRRA